MDLFGLSKWLYEQLLRSGVNFSVEGYPIFSDDMFLKEIPKYLIPFGKKYADKDKKDGLLVSFCNDEIVYKKLFSLEKDISYYKEYKGFGGFDLSPRINWDINLQKFNIALNKMADAYLAINGVKLIPNFRTGSVETINVLNCYPSNSWYTVGTLGCSKGYNAINEKYLRTKVLLTNPDMLLFYGKLKTEYATFLDEFGINYKVYPDFQSVSRRKEVA